MKASAPQQCFGWKSKDGPPQVRQQIGALLTMMVAAASAHHLVARTFSRSQFSIFDKLSILDSSAHYRGCGGEEHLGFYFPGRRPHAVLAVARLRLCPLQRLERQQADCQSGFVDVRLDTRPQRPRWIGAFSAPSCWRDARTNGVSPGRRLRGMTGSADLSCATQALGSVTRATIVASEGRGKIFVAKCDLLHSRGAASDPMS